jgi:hypothetical protein
MKWLADLVMARRARSLLAHTRPYLPRSGLIADIGSGTGHNAEAIRSSMRLAVQEYDVVDLHWVGPGPVVFEPPQLPAGDHTYDAILIVFVLQYSESAFDLLQEARRVTRGPVIILQSTYHGWLGRIALGVRECLWGRFAFRLAVLARVISSKVCPLKPRRYFTRAELRELILSVGFNVLAMEPAEWFGLEVSRDLFIVESSEP